VGVRTCLDAATERPLKQVCTETLFVEHFDTLLKTFPQLLRDGREDDMARMYRLFSRHQDGAKLIAPFESRLRKAGLANVVNGGPTDYKPKPVTIPPKSPFPGSGG
jgi:hypothetical protein